MTSPPAEDDLSRADIGLVAALPFELEAFLSRCERVRKYTGGDFVFRGGRYDGIRIAIVESGTGQVRARRAVQALVDAHHPHWIVSTGFAGALQPGMKVGQILVANRVMTPGQPEILNDVQMASDPHHAWIVGGLLTVDHIVRTVEEKTSLGEAYGCHGVDMETYAVAEYCKTTRQKFFAVRAISDDLSSDLPAEVLSLMGPTGAVRMGAVIGALWKRPGSVQDMWRLREQAHHSAEQLASFLDGVVRQLHAASDRHD